MSTAAANDTATERARISSAPGNNSDNVTSEAGSGANTTTESRLKVSDGSFGGRKVIAPRHSRPDANQASSVVSPVTAAEVPARRWNSCSNSSGTAVLL